ATLAWTAGGETGSRPVPLPEGTRAHAEGTLLWDLAELTLPPGAEVRYWLEATDNDDVGEPQRGRSREFRLHVWSPRQRHQQHLVDQRAVVERMLADLALRLPGLGDAVAPRVEQHARTTEVAAAVGALAAAYAQDPHADAGLRRAVADLRDRLDRLLAAEGRALDKLPRDASASRGLGARLAGSDGKLVAELEDAIVLLADWLEREELEGVLDVADEAAAHQRRLGELLAEMARTGDASLRADVARELRALERSLAELAEAQGGLAEDVLDRFVHADAARAQLEPRTCVAEVRALFERGQVAAAQARLAACQTRLSTATTELETALDGLRGARFGDEQRAYDQVLDELEAIGREQDDIAAQTGQLFDRYAQRVDAAARDRGAAAQGQVEVLLERLRRRLDEVPAGGLTPFSTEELDIAARRLDDVARMVGGGDLAEAEAMARQAQASLDTIAAELEAALADEPTSRWAGETRRAQAAIERAQPVLDELIALLAGASPAPHELLSPADRDELERLRRRQGANAERARRLAERGAKQGPLPGTAGEELGRRMGPAQGSMRTAEARMRAVDPSGARQGARDAADAMAKARTAVRGAARQRQDGTGGGGEGPIKIPGADDYRAPEQFREEVLEAMKRRAPTGTTSRSSATTRSW
ncbi:MAG: hypothetical protein R2939_04870, partial [Kofleriaceae bacterium]